MSTKELLKSGLKHQDGWKWFIPMVKPIEFNKKELLIEPYLLGLLIGDGGLTNEIRFTTSDEELLEKVDLLLPNGLKLIYRNNYDWAITSGKYNGGHKKNILKEQLKEMGLMGKKSEHKFIPEQYKYSCVEDRIKILRGLLDTDGSISSTGEIEYSSSSKKLAEDVVFIVQSLGGKANIKSRTTKCLISYRMNITLPNDIIPFQLTRKVNRIKKRVKYFPTRAIVSIEELDKKEEMTCISVNSFDNLYVAEHCIVTHNTMFQLHLVELWYRVILQQELTKEHIKYVQNTRRNWIRNFKDLQPLDINSNDEGADGIVSKEGMTKFGRDIQKLYNVFRKKLFFTPILIPDYFDLPLYFRKRVRGCFEINKKGQFKYYTMENLKWVNALNENKEYKRMNVTYPFFTGTFPDYTGILRKPYDEMAQTSADNILDEMIDDIDSKSFNTVKTHFDEVKKYLDEGIKQEDIAELVGISRRDVSAVRKKIKIDDLKSRGYNAK
jgi:hypothetical protein